MNKPKRKLGKKKNDKLKEKRAFYEAKFESVKRWRNGVVNNTSGSSQTKMKHLNFLIKTCEELGMNPDEIIEARIQDLKSTDPRIRCRFEDKILEVTTKFREENGYYIGREISTSMKSFFFHNHVPLTITSPKIKDPKTYTPTKEALERFYQMASPGAERSRISLVFQSLMRRGSIPYLKYKHIKKDFEAGIIPIHIHLDIEEVKGKYFAYDTFIGKQAVEDLRLSLEQRKRGTRKIPPEIISDESPLCRKGTTRRIEPLDETGLTTWYVSLSRQIGLNKEETITPHALRRAGETILEKSKTMPLNWIDLIMGHRPRSAQGKHYSKPSVEELRAAYAEAEPYLTLSLTSPADGATTLRSAKEAANSTSIKNERIETKPLDRLTEQEIKRLDEKRQLVQQSMSAYLKSSSIQTQPLKVGVDFPDDDKLEKTPAAAKTAKTADLSNSYKAEICAAANEQVSSLYQVTGVTAKDEIIRLLGEGWEFFKKLSDGTVLLGKRMPSDTMH